MKPPGFDKRFIVYVAITDRVARILFAGMHQFSALRDIPGIGKGRHRVVAGVHRIAATMIPVEVGIDHQVYGFRLEAFLCQCHMRMNALLHSHALQPSDIVPYSAAGLDQNALAAVFYNKAVEASFNTIEVVARLVFRPEGFGDDAEHGPAVPKTLWSKHQASDDLNR